jgi:hypothetical protein
MDVALAREGSGDRGPGARRRPTPARKPSTAYLSVFAFALAASQSAFDIDTQPVPLQLFMPLQLFFADLHSDVPLQEFTPVQWTVAVSAATDTLASPDVNNIAAVAASAALDNLLICMIDSSIVIERSDIAASPTKTRPTCRLLLNYLSLCFSL